MEYTKPTVTVLGSAAAHIQGAKPAGTQDSEVDIRNSVGAYEADE